MTKLTRLLTIVIVLQGMILAGQWLGSGHGYLTSAQAQVTDPGRDRMQLLDEMRKTNDKLDKLMEILRSGDLQVRVIQPDDNKARTTAR
jgi:hypothetical protein